MQGQLLGTYRKTHLVPGENLFEPGTQYPVFNLKGLKYGINICYDAQFPDSSKAVADQGARVILLPAQNMMRRENAEKWKHQHNRIRTQRVKETGAWLISSDVTGERASDRIAYGPTCAINPQGEVVAQVPLMQTGLIAVDVPVG
jgi:predicted amidohydrolase